MTHPQRSADAVAGFLRKALAGRVLDVSELEAKARAAGLLAESQRITHSKIFKSAKKSLGIRSTRDGFGAGGKWIWVLPSEAAAPAIPLKSGPERGTPPTGAKSRPERVAPATGTKSRPETAACAKVHLLPAELRGRNVPWDWLDGIAKLDYDRTPTTDIPIHRWRQFVNDCYIFVSSSENWAERATSSVWDAMSLFGCRRTRPLQHFGSAGLVWAICGGRLVELHRDWALIERAEDRSRRVYHRRRPDAANLLPWMF